MRYNDLLGSFVELNNLEVQLVFNHCTGTVFLDKMLRRGKSFNTVRQGYNSSLVKDLDDSSFMNLINREEIFEHIPRILLELLVAQAEPPVVLVYLKYHYLYLSIYRGELGRMLDLLGP